MKENFVSSVIDHYQNEVLPDEKYSSLVFKNKLNKRWWKCKMTFVISIKKRLTCWCNTIYEYNSSVVLYSFLVLLYSVISHCLYIYFALTFNPAPIIIICTFPKNGAHYFSGVVGCSGSRIRCKKSMKVEYWKVGKSIYFFDDLQNYEIAIKIIRIVELKNFLLWKIQKNVEPRLFKCYPAIQVPLPSYLLIRHLVSKNIQVQTWKIGFLGNWNYFLINSHRWKSANLLFRYLTYLFEEQRFIS